MITENMIIGSSLATAGTALLTTEAVVDKFQTDLLFLSGPNEFTFVLWVVGGLLAVIAALLAAVTYFVRDMRNNNRSDHLLIYHKIEAPGTGLEPRLAHLEGSHEAAFLARGCAYDEVRLNKAIEEIIYDILRKRAKIRSMRSTDNVRKIDSITSKQESV